MNAYKWLLPALALTFAGLACQTVMRAISPGATAQSPTREPQVATPSPNDPTAPPSSAEYSVPDEGRYHIDFGQTAG